jgi:hypothetical protein
MEDMYYEEIRLSRSFAREFEKYRWSFTSETYRDLVAAYNELKRHYEIEIEEGVQ